MRFPSLTSLILGVAAAGLLVSTPAFAGKPTWGGGGNSHGHGHSAKSDKGSHGKGGKFSDQGRDAVRQYYEAQFKGGNCPPGLAKKHNGCMPPGQAKQWNMDQPLPRDVVTYEVPHELEVKIGIPPVGYKYVRVANDILMVAAGTNMVVDAIQDLGR